VVKHKEYRSISTLYICNYYEEVVHSTCVNQVIEQWRLSKNRVSTTWGTDFGIANHVVITLSPSSCYIQKASIITIPLFQHSYPHKLYQHLEFFYHIYCDHFLVRANYDLASIIDCNEIWLMWWFSLIYGYRITISWCFSVVLVFDQHCGYFFLEFGILLFSGFEWLIVWGWSKHSCLCERMDELYILD